MNIMTNLNALNASRHLGINSANYKKSTEKLSSGYKINRAADGAAELGISEQMRAQIRGLNRSVTNAEEGANFIQTGDGSMNEIHAILQRMRELSVQSLNDTNTPADRAALAAEFNELQSEIDRISKGTYFNTQPVFQEHEASYYQIAGNRSWAANQQHSISSPNNTLTIHLPEDLYAPPENEYTIQVPDGVYTTQELIDEIEDAFTAMDTPAPNPGFVLEYTDEGYCNLNFENTAGEPVKIDTVDGPLSYLIYDSCSGNSSANLLGTTIFTAEGRLNIKSDTNDQLIFLMEALDGTSKRVELTIPPGNYNRQEMIDELNHQLSEEGLTDQGVIAAEYGSSSIQITGGSAISITGLKGNMFTIETGTDIYTSVFYDNICPGSVIDTPAKFYSTSYYNANYTENYKIDSTNNHLKFNIGNEVVDFTFSSQQKEYTLDEMAEELNKMFSLGNCPVKAEITSVHVPSGNGYISGTYSCLVLTGTETGNDLAFSFDTSDPVCKKTYDTLFCNTNYDHATPPITNYGSDPSPESPAVLTGLPALPASISLPNEQNTLGIIINGTTYTLTDIPRGPHTQSDLAQILNDKLNASLPADLKDKVSIEFSGGKLTIRGTTNAVTSISIDRSSETGRQLFAAVTTSPNMGYQGTNGHETYKPVQGSVESEKDFVPATLTMRNEIPNDITEIKSPNHTLSFLLNGRTISLTLTPGSYSREELVGEINRQLQNHTSRPNVTASLTGSRLTLTTTETGTNCSHSLSVPSNTPIGTAWDVITGTTAATRYPQNGSVTPASPGTPARLISEHRFTSVTINGDNNKFVFRNDGKTYTVTLDNGTYDPAALAAHLQAKINSDPSIQELDAVTVTYDPGSSSQGLVITAKKPGYNYYTIEQNGFYNTVLKKPVKNQVHGTPTDRKSKHTYVDPYIIGREDLVNNKITFEEGLNDTFTIDLNYEPVSPSTNPAYTETLTVQFPPGEMTGDEIAAYLQEKLDEQLKDLDLKAEVRIGADNSVPVEGSNDTTALQIKIKETASDTPTGTYTLDGVRGNAAYFIFYRTTTKPSATYITGTHDISDGIVFEPGKNELTFKLDGVPYRYEFPAGTRYTAQEFIDLLNDDFENGTINGTPVPLRASLENGSLKLTYQSYGPHTITEISGSAKGTVFFHEEERDHQDPYMLQVGALGHQVLELTRLRVNTASLGINSVTISRPKYANKALDRLDYAIDQLSSRRSLYGALQNRIEFLTSNNQNTAQNLQASESRIRDANMAAEMMEHIKNKITTQASEAVLAQANQLPSTVLVMLQQD